MKVLKAHKQCPECIEVGYLNACMQLQDWIRQNNKHSVQIDRIIGEILRMANADAT